MLHEEDRGAGEAGERAKISNIERTPVRSWLTMGVLKKAKEKAEEAAKKTGKGAGKVGEETVKLGKKGAEEIKETAKKVKKKL